MDPALIGIRQYQANRKIEDRFDTGELRIGSRVAQAFSVFDGHGGWEIAQYLQENLHKRMGDALSEVESPTAQMIADVMRQTYVDCDELIAKALFPIAVDMKFSRVARVGSCSLSVIIDGDDIICANAGDCQAVLVRENEVTRMNNIHNANEALEQERMLSAKPDDDGIICIKARNKAGQFCRVKGMLQPTRSFGDFHLKTPKLIYDHEYDRNFLTVDCPQFPYITAEPEVSIYHRNGKGWVVLATDGLWDAMSMDQMRRICARSQSAQQIADELTQRALEMIALSQAMTVQKLRAIPFGKQRRAMHDDITVIVVKL